MSGVGRALAAVALAALAACGVKGPPRPPAGATRTPGAAAVDDDACRVADTAPGADCGPKAAKGQGNQR